MRKPCRVHVHARFAGCPGFAIAIASRMRPSARGLSLTYSAYGTARHHPFGDTDGDGDADVTDSGQVTAALGKVIGDVGYRSELDLNRDGVITTADRNLIVPTSALPEGRLSASAIDNQIGFCGYVFAPETGMYLGRNRWLSTVLGRWVERDWRGVLARGDRPTPLLQWSDGSNLYQFIRGRIFRFADPMGSRAITPPWLDQLENTCRASIDRPIDLLSIFDLGSMLQYQRLTARDRGLIWVFVQTQSCIMAGIKSCATCHESAEWLVNTSRDFMRPFVESLRERADQCAITDPGWSAFFRWLDAGGINVPWMPDPVLRRIDENLLGFAQRLEIARRMALNHINSDLRNALLRNGIGQTSVWRCIGREVDRCQRAIVGPMAVGGDILARFLDEFDVQHIRDRMRDEVREELVRRRISKCCNET